MAETGKDTILKIIAAVLAIIFYSLGLLKLVPESPKYLVVLAAAVPLALVTIGFLVTRWPYHVVTVVVLVVASIAIVAFWNPPGPGTLQWTVVSRTVNAR